MHAAILRRHRYDQRAAFKDYELWTRLIHQSRMGNVPAVLLRYRRHAEQVHVIEAAALRADIARLRGPLFDALFPDADLGDGEILDRVAEGIPFATVTDLEHAGSLLVRLAQDQETLLRRRMLERWRGACRTSAQLGTAAWRCYERGVPQFGVPATRDDRRLRAACALRISSDSRLAHGVNGFVNASRRIRHAAS
jgi:hypothetical protein